MARRSMSILKERKLKLSTEIAILGEINVEDFRSKDIQRKFLDKKLRLEIRLEEVDGLLIEEAGKVQKRDRKKLADNDADKFREEVLDGPPLIRIGDQEEKAVSDGSDYQDWL